MQFVNLIPHAINIFNEQGDPITTIEPSGTVARLTAEREHIDTVADVPLYVTRYGDVQDLPAIDPDVAIMYIVSGLVRSALPERRDLWQPGELLRNAQGQPIGCVGLSQ